MKFYLLVLVLFSSVFAHAEGSSADFKFELSCVRTGEDSPTIAVHAVISYTDADNACAVEKGFYLKGAQEYYEIEFSCERPLQLSNNKNHPLFTWVLSGPDMPTDRISKLMVILDHEKEVPTYIWNHK